MLSFIITNYFAFCFALLHHPCFCLFLNVALIFIPGSLFHFLLFLLLYPVSVFFLLFYMFSSFHALVSLPFLSFILHTILTLSSIHPSHYLATLNCFPSSSLPSFFPPLSSTLIILFSSLGLFAHPFRCPLFCLHTFFSPSFLFYSLFSFTAPTIPLVFSPSFLFASFLTSITILSIHSSINTSHH